MAAALANFRRLLRNESGATAIEYSLIAGLIGIAIVGSLFTYRDSLQAIFVDGIANKIDAALE